jgi:hypothetical protein
MAPAIKLQPSLMQKIIDIDINMELKQLGASLARPIHNGNIGKLHEWTHDHDQVFGYVRDLCGCFNAS